MDPSAHQLSDFVQLLAQETWRQLHFVAQPEFPLRKRRSWESVHVIGAIVEEGVASREREPIRSGCAGRAAFSGFGAAREKKKQKLRRERFRSCLGRAERDRSRA